MGGFAKVADTITRGRPLSPDPNNVVAVGAGSKLQKYRDNLAKKAADRQVLLDAQASYGDGSTSGLTGADLARLRKNRDGLGGQSGSTSVAAKTLLGQ